MTARRDRRERRAVNALTRRLRLSMRKSGKRIRYGGAYVDRQGREIDLPRWSALFEWRRYRFIAHTRVTSQHEVVTIWMGVIMPGRANEFSTAVFINGALKDDAYQRTEAEALVCHHSWVREIRINEATH